MFEIYAIVFVAAVSLITIAVIWRREATGNFWHTHARDRDAYSAAISGKYVKRRTIE